MYDVLIQIYDIVYILVNKKSYIAYQISDIAQYFLFTISDILLYI